MNKIVKFGAAALLALVSAGTLTSCSDWTDTKSVDLKYETVDKADPATYAKYLAALRAYRQSDHKLVYAWFDNPGANQLTTTQANRVASLPDSVDVVVFQNPTSVSKTCLDEMKKMRSQKGMRNAYVINFDAIKLAYLEHQALATEDEPYSVEFLDFLTDTTATALSYAKKYDFDGIIINYVGKDLTLITGQALVDYKNNENTFIGILEDWHARNPKAKIDFIGRPQFVANKALLADCEVLFLSASETAAGPSAWNLEIISASVEGVNPDDFGVIAVMPDPNDNKVGYMADGQLAAFALSEWANTANVKAVGYKNASYDYFNVAYTYPILREAIQLVNPSNN